MKNDELKYIRDKYNLKHKDISILTDTEQRTVRGWLSYGKNENRMPKSALYLMKIRLFAIDFKDQEKSVLSSDILDLLIRKIGE